MANYARDLEPELRVNYCNLVVIWVDDPVSTRAARAELGTGLTFLCDPSRTALKELDLVDTTDPAHGEIAIPYTFVLDGDREIYKIYNGWWYLGRPTVEELRLDLRDLMARRPDWWYENVPPPYARSAEEPEEWPPAT